MATDGTHETMVTPSDIQLLLSSAEGGDVFAQSRLCKFFFDTKDVVSLMPDDSWKRVERLADHGEDYANFIMHCKYFRDPAQAVLSYYYIRKAIRSQKTPLAFLRLGVMYAHGIGTLQNHALAVYLYEKALSMDCEEAYQYIEQEYESGAKDLVKDFEKAIAQTGTMAPRPLKRFRRLLERERTRKNYGILSKLRKHLHLFYPDYTQEKAIVDILSERDTIDADLFFATSTPDNTSEVNVDQMESLLQQLYAPITREEELLRRIIESEECDLLDNEVNELLQCVVNLSSSYQTVCKDYKIDEKESVSVNYSELSPCIKPSTLVLLRKQAVRCLLSIKDVNPLIADQYLNNLDNDEKTLTFCLGIKDTTLQLFLISFVELNIDIDHVEYYYQDLLRSYHHQELEALAKRLNEYARRLTDVGIEHQLPRFTPKNLPPIDLSEV